MKQIGSVFLLLAFCCAAAHAGEEDLVASLLTNGMWARATSEGYVLYSVHGSQATLRRTREGYVWTGRDGSRRTFRRTPEGFAVTPYSPTSAVLPKVTPASDGYWVTDSAGKATRIWRTSDGLRAAPGAPTNAGLGEAFDAAYRRSPRR